MLLPLASIVISPAVFDIVAAVPERERVTAPELAPRAIIPSDWLEILSVF